ncbi:MAG: MFS transporter [Aquabacterium sp.]|uniref:MFS transporter n=1 Tax=Aquabacterium sp. TaxID=1872578 RepID=UPI00121FB13A|nr:MFS transporter [Aquabacterium sp.]TAK97102.1 MAG: MFS transporter [Aquabacterium sp.]
MSEPQENSQAQRIALLTGLYTAQGIPFGFFTLALPVLMRDAGWSLTSIGFLQFLALPWGIKFLWAPALDHHGSRRGWLMFFQCAACLMALILSQLDLKAGSLILFGAVFLFNLLAASQDIVTDGLAVRLLGAKERGLANAIQVGAYRLGMILGGGLLLWIFSHEGWQVMFLCMAGLLGLTILPVLPLKEPPRHTAPSNRPQGMALVIGWLHRALAPGMLTFFGLILCFRFGDQILNSLLPPFLLDHGVSKSTIALMKGGVGSATSLLGASIGGWLVYQLGRRKAMLLAGLSQAAGFGLYVAVAFQMGGVELLWAATVLEGIVGTMATVALFTLMMDASDPEHAGTDYTLLASVVVAVSSLGSLAGGVLGDKLGYGTTFLIATCLAVAGTLFVVWWLDRHPTNERIAEAWR